MQVDQMDDFDDDGYPLMGATGPNLIQNDIIDIVVDNNKRYGMRVTNNTPWDLYPYAFLFSNSTLKISKGILTDYLFSSDGFQVDTICLRIVAGKSKLIRLSLKTIP